MHTYAFVCVVLKIYAYNMKLFMFPQFYGGLYPLPLALVCGDRDLTLSLYEHNPFFLFCFICINLIVMGLQILAVAI